MTILELIKAACKTKGVPEKYAERIQKTFKIEKAEGMEAYVDLFKENVLPAIQEAENEAKTAAETAAVSAYEAKHGLKDGKPAEVKEETKSEDELLKGLSPEVKAYLEKIEKKFEDSIKKVDTSISNSANEAKKEIVRKQLKDAGLPENWLNRVDLSAETSIEDQVKNLSNEYTSIQQKAIDDAVAKGDYTPGNIQMPERSEADWAKLMNGENTGASNPGVVDLGI